MAQLNTRRGGGAQNWNFRCSSVLRVPGDKGKRDVHCTMTQEHGGSHKGRVNNLSVTWTTAEGLESLRPAPILLTQAPIGWRAWKIEKHDILRSLTSGSLWEGPVMTTKLKSDGTLKRVWSERTWWMEPHLYDYGVYSYKTLEYLNNNLMFIHTHPLKREAEYYTYPVFGKVECHGHVVPHAYGYRAQKVVINHLWYTVPKGVELITDKSTLEDRYQCPVEVLPAHKLVGFLRYYIQEEKEHGDRKGNG